MITKSPFKMNGAPYTSRGPKEMDPMYNGQPGIQKKDFEQFSKKGSTDEELSLIHI